MKQRRIVVLGFDHGQDDRRITKDIKALKNRFEITYFYRSEEHEVSFVKDGVTYVGLPVENKHSRVLRRIKYENMMTSRAIAIGADYFYMHGMFITFPGYFLRKLKSSGQIIYDAHEYDLEPIYIKNSMLRKLLACFLWFRQKNIARKITSSFTVSPSILIFMKKCNFKDIYLKPNISNSIVFEPISLRKRKPVIVIAGNISRERGTMQFLEIFKKMKERENSLALHFHVKILDIELEKQLKQWVDANLPIGSVLFQGFLPYSQLIKKLSQSLAGVMAFPSDGSVTNKIALPNRFFDTLASGTPIIASKESVDVAEYVLSKNIGWLFDPNNPSEDISIFSEEINDHEIYQEKLNNVHDFANAHDVDSLDKLLKRVF